MSELKGKSIAILGGTGTVGKAVVRELKQSAIEVNRLVIFSRDEIKQLEMMEDFPESGSLPIEYFLGDVRDQDRLEEVLKGVDFVIHAAAIKHVVMAERNPEECYKTNVLGTQNIIDACVENHVDRAILISTDKALDPIGVYGKSKLQAEELWMNANSSHQQQPIFKAVRLGNVVGARGSVFEAFNKQKKTGTLKVSHPDATRFYIAPEKAAAFILEALLGNGDRITSPEMESFRILDLAREIGPDCEIEFTGLRPGDKLHEEIDGKSSSQLLSPTNVRLQE